MRIRDVVDRASMFRTMPESVRARLADVAIMRRCRDGEYLWRAGDPGDNLQIVCEGLVLIGAIGPDGDEILLHVVGPGECMGEPSMYAESRERLTNARAVGRTSLLLIPGHRARPVLESNPEAMRAFVQRLSEICRAHSRRVSSSAFHDARSRLARVILDLAASHGEQTPVGSRIGLPLSQRTLAGLLSVRRESVNRMLGELERLGAVQIKGTTITVRSPKVLREAIGVDGWLS